MIKVKFQSTRFIVKEQGKLLGQKNGVEYYLTEDTGEKKVYRFDAHPLVSVSENEAEAEEIIGWFDSD